MPTETDRPAAAAGPASPASPANPLRPLKRVLRACLDRLPPRTRLAADYTLAGLAGIAAHWRLPAYRIVGRRRADGEPCTLVHFGQEPQYRAWIANYLDAAGSAEYAGSYTLKRIWRSEDALADADLVLCPLPPLAERLFAANGWLTVPKYVRCVIDLGVPTPQLLARHAVKDDLRIVRKKDYRYAVLRDDAFFDEFYHRMLVPTVIARHEERAHVSSPDALRRVYRKGYLLAAFLGTDWVAACLMVPRAGNTLDWANVGWRDGSEALMKERVVSALLEEMIRRAKDDGYACLDLGSCSPFVDDGPLNYKLKWGAHIELPSLAYEDGRLQGVNAHFAVRFRPGERAGNALLAHSPVFAKRRGELIAVGWNSPLRADFRHQLDAGLPWIDLAATQLDGHPADGTPQTRRSPIARKNALR